eukprot:Lankesteria_metandrocarpae@DN530_c0_g1_i1.p1
MDASWLLLLQLLFAVVGKAEGNKEAYALEEYLFLKSAENPIHECGVDSLYTSAGDEEVAWLGRCIDTLPVKDNEPGVIIALVQQQRYLLLSTSVKMFSEVVATFKNGEGKLVFAYDLPYRNMAGATDFVPNLYYYTSKESEHFMHKAYYGFTVTRLAPNYYILIPHFVKKTVREYLGGTLISLTDRGVLVSVPETENVPSSPVPQHELRKLQNSTQKLWFNIELWLLRSKPISRLFQNRQTDRTVTPDFLFSRNRNRSPNHRSPDRSRRSRIPTTSPVEKVPGAALNGAMRLPFGSRPSEVATQAVANCFSEYKNDLSSNEGMFVFSLQTPFSLGEKGALRMITTYKYARFGFKPDAQTDGHPPISTFSAYLYPVPYTNDGHDKECNNVRNSVFTNVKLYLCSPKLDFSELRVIARLDGSVFVTSVDPVDDATADRLATMTRKYPCQEFVDLHQYVMGRREHVLFFAE